MWSYSIVNSIVIVGSLSNAVLEDIAGKTYMQT